MSAQTVDLWVNRSLDADTLTPMSSADREITTGIKERRSLTISSTVILKVEVREKHFDGPFTVILPADTMFIANLGPGREYKVRVTNRGSFAADIHINVTG